MNKVIILLTLILIVSSIDSNAAPLPIGSAFSYQGKLMDSGSPANGNYDIGFELFTTEMGNLSLWTDEFLNISVSNGQFTLPQVDFGDAVLAAGTEIWINLYVTKTGSGLPYVELMPRQRLNAVPFAVQAEFLAAGSANTNDVLQFDGADWVATAITLNSPWNYFEDDIYFNTTGNVGIGVDKPHSKLVIKSVSGLDPLKVTVGNLDKFKISENGGVAIGTQTLSTTIPNDGLFVYGEIKGSSQTNGLMKYMVYAICGDPSSIVRQYNGTETAGDIVMAFTGAAGLCQFVFPTEIYSRYFQASIVSSNGNSGVSCNFVIAQPERLTCRRTFNNTAQTGAMMLLMY